MYRREKLTKQKLDSKKIIDMIVRLYILMIRTESDEVQKEVNILYTLLENLFLSEDISWETYVREIKQAPSNLKDVISFLNKSLITLDKIRIILSLIVLANSDNDLETSEVTRILELAKSFKLEPTTFMEIINSLEFDSEKTVSMPGFRFFSHTQRSIFKDYLSVGTRNENDVQFKDSKVSIDEVLILKIESYFFIGTSSTCSSYLNGKRLEPRKIYTFPDKSILQIGNEFFDYTHLERIYESQFVDDVIQFKKSTYSFDVYNRKNNYSVNVHSGKVYLNGKELPYNREIKLHFNDVIQIKGYDPFKILTIIEQREVIGTETLVPDNLFINADSGNYSISQQETQQTIVTLVRIEDSYILKPPLKRGFDLFLNNKRVLEETNFRVNRDTLTINKNNFRINNLYDLVEVPFEIDYINILDIKHHYADGQLALDGISLEAQKGELIAIMGPSGCGKSTFVKAISAQIIPKYGSIFLDGKDLYSNLGYFSQYIGYIPQEDLLYSELTVYENLYYRGRLRMPQLPKDRLDQKIANILMQTKLTHCRNTRVGAETQLLLSGGERKRLNLALELLFEPQIVICDEPTSGLSSSDSEKIVEILKGLTQQGRIVLVTIHQPNPNLFEQFDRILLMDNGGKQVYYGGTREVFAYFDTELSLANHYVEALNRKKKLMMPDYLFDMIEYPALKSSVTHYP